MPDFTSSEFPIDQNANPIPVLAPGTSARIASVTTSSNRVSLPGDAAAGDIVRVAVSQDCYIAFGDNTVTAAVTDVLMTSGAIEYMVVPDGATDIAAIRVSTDGTLCITEML